MMTMELWAGLAAVIAAVAAVAGAFFKGRSTGREAVQREHLQERVTGAQERANADADAARSDDPAAELRRDWRRGL